MSDQKRNQNQNREPQQAGRDEVDQGIGSTSGNRGDSMDRADDRGMDREPRNIGGPREGDRRESETTDEPFVGGEVDPLDDEMGESGHSDR